MERIVARKLALDLERRHVLPQTQGRYRGEEKKKKTHLEKRSQICIRCLCRISEEGTNSGRGGRSGRCVQQSAIQTADGTPCAIWRQLDAHKMARGCTPEKKDCPATWKLDLLASATDTGTSTRLPLSPDLYNVYTKELVDLNSNGLSRILTPADDGLIFKTASDIHIAVTAVQEQLEKCHSGAQRQSPKSTQARRKPCGAPSTAKQ